MCEGHSNSLYNNTVTEKDMHRILLFLTFFEIEMPLVQRLANA